ncbi:MAG: hypothetical protein GY791_15260 [Alphaproteobacteria bacterium]|nr:hypothetical protein [Alphaproteobacteria bacterium]
MTLPVADQTPIAALSRSDIQDTFAGLKRFVRDSRWIGKTNRYAKSVVERLKRDHPLTQRQKRNLAQYIAASAVLHANDAWGYVGRTVACLMTGDAHRALHLAYYAELRAGMSLLAGAGIGVFNHRHFIVSDVNATARLTTNLGTHQIAWAALKYWSQQPSSGALFARLVRPEGHTLDDWFLPVGGSQTLAPQAQDWFQQWGMDLNLATRDRDARNESSYRPDGIPSTWTITPTARLGFVQDLWAALEPSIPSSFEEIDRHILRYALERHFAGSTGTIADRGNREFVRLVDQILAARGLSQSAAKRWRDFLLRRQVPKDPTIFHYSTNAPIGQAIDVFSVTSRAVLLLRIATGSANDLLQKAGFRENELEFWWRPIGETRGLWAIEVPPETLSDLWADVRDAIDDIARLGDADPRSMQTATGIATNLGDRFSVLCSHERVGLWALCPG